MKPEPPVTNALLTSAQAIPVCVKVCSREATFFREVTWRVGCSKRSPTRRPRWARLRSRRRSALPPASGRTRSRSAPRQMRSRSPGGSCASAWTRWPRALPSSESGAGTLAVSDVEATTANFYVEPSVAALRGSDVHTLIYPSGTTGPPKGVELVHRNLLAAVEGLEELIEFPRDGRVISWLPAAHVAERNAHHYLPIVFGLQVTCCHDPRQILSYLPEVRPSWFFAVPRIWEKLKAGLETMIAGQPAEQGDKTRAAIDAALEKVRAEQRGAEVPAELAATVAAADAGIF